MSNTRELRRRIKSVKNTSQITRAMQMVAATKMRRAQSQTLSGRPYLQALNYVLHKLESHQIQDLHPLLRSNEASKTGLLIITTDKGLCGSLNTNIFKATLQFIKDKKVSFFTLGKKGRQFVLKAGHELIADFESSESISFRKSMQIAKLLISSFLNNELKEVYLIYPHFVSTLKQEAVCRRLIPIEPKFLEELVSAKKDEGKNNKDFLFEPKLGDLLDFILTHAIESEIYQSLLETKASEHSARMIAMQNATQNAKELVEDLKLTYNQTRQSSITTELLEITSAQAALE